MKKKSFLERLTGNIRVDEDELEDDFYEEGNAKKTSRSNGESKSIEVNKEEPWEEETDAELTVDLYQTPTDIIVQTMVAGVQPDNLSITITRDLVTIKGKREENQSIEKNNYFVKELYWGSFSRTISLPEEVDPEEAEAVEKHGLLIIKLPKLDKNRETKLKIKSI
ncbi:MAG TPA: Hsp20/alpha crystallin family protein [Candidatus Paceibacterota bacterium]|nr:Hsp20/alpha crystallin family protein [Candidatus Paceibacterota bacterium]HPI82718.1 Hsp20/alpha crystallin family protein [Candidatus Paceibacterota bacterium]HPR84377.1 Hsp20/alpha crystallin family protein [Candidatus Paceibacterota bacterium]